MRVSIWYHTADRNPSESGYYLCYRCWGMGGKADGDHDYEHLYYHKKSDTWFEYESEVRSTLPRTCWIYYWTDARPDAWVENDPPVVHRVKKSNNPALSLAWENVENAIKQYELIKKLTQ